MVVSIDPETGRLAMTRADRGVQLMERVDARQAGPAPVFHRDGSVSHEVRGWMREYAVVRLGPDGRPAFGCVDEHAKASGALKKASLQPAAPEEE